MCHGVHKIVPAELAQSGELFIKLFCSWGQVQEHRKLTSLSCGLFVSYHTSQNCAIFMFAPAIRRIKLTIAAGNLAVKQTTERMKIVSRVIPIIIRAQLALEIFTEMCNCAHTQSKAAIRHARHVVNALSAVV